MSALDNVHYSVGHKCKCQLPQILHYGYMGKFQIEPWLEPSSPTTRSHTIIGQFLHWLWPCVSSILHSCGHCSVIFFRYVVHNCQTNNVSVWLWTKWNMNFGQRHRDHINSTTSKALEMLQCIIVFELEVFFLFFLWIQFETSEI